MIDLFARGLAALQTTADAWQRASARPELAEAWARWTSLVGQSARPGYWLEHGLCGGAVRSEPTPWQVAWRQGSAVLRRYEPAAGKRLSRPLLLVYALVNRPSVLDLMPGRSVIARLLEASVPVYLLDWGRPTAADSEVPLDGLVSDTLGGAVRSILEREGLPSLHILGYCQGGTLAALHALGEPQTVKSLGLLAAPIDFSKMGSLRTCAHSFEPRAAVGPDGNVSGAFLKAAFESLQPFGAALRWGSFFSGLATADDEARTHFCAMERWIADAVDHPGRAYVELVERFYHRNELLPRLAELEVPLLTAVGTRDHLVPPAATEAALSASASRDTLALRCESGHIGLSVGTKAHRELWPAVVEWLRRQDHD